jgi:hypothetical protein
MGKQLELPALIAATLLTGAAIYGMPSWDFDICRLAAIAAILTMVVLHVTRHLGERGVSVERAVCALFLAGMPLVYIIAWLTRGTSPGWLAVEVAGFPIYAALALTGWRRWPWLLVAGIAAHGIAWDAWHYLSGYEYIPRWYVTGCLLADVGISGYLATRVPAWSVSKEGAV